MLCGRLLVVELLDYSLSTLVLLQTALSPSHLAMRPLRSHCSLILLLLLRGAVPAVECGLAMILVHILIVICEIFLLQLGLVELD